MNDLNESSDPTPSEPSRKSLNLSKPVMALAGSVMLMPAFIPFWFAIQADTTQMTLIFAGMGAMLVVVNLLVLYVVYRWLQLF